jgi:tetratricopeptide (TPR) repeat protein
MNRLSRIVPILLMVAVLIAAGGCTKKARAKRMIKAATIDFLAEKYDAAEIEYKNAMQMNGMDPFVLGQLGRICEAEGRILDAHVILAKADEMLPNNPAIEISLGKVDVAFHDTSNAVHLAEKVLKQQPTNADALLLLSDSFAPVNFEEQIIESLPHPEENPAYHVVEGIMALRRKKTDQCASELHAAIAANPKMAEAYFAEAELYAVEKDSTNADEALKTAAGLAPVRSFIRTRYTEFLMQSGKRDEAHAALKEVLDKAPDYLPAWVTLMDLDMSEAKYDDAASCASTILDRDARNYQALLSRSSISLAKGDVDKAVAQLENMATIYGRSPQVKYELANAYLTQHDKVKCMAALNEALTLDPGYGQAAVMLAELDIRNGDPASAIALLERYSKKAPGVIQTQLLMADAYIAENKPDEAIAIYGKLAEALPKSPQFPVLIGVTYAEHHRIPQAQAEFEQALKLAPDFVPAVQQLVNLYLSTENYKAAVTLVQGVAARNPKAAEPWELLAQIHVAQDHSADAEEDLRKAIELNPDLPTPYLLLAQVYVKTKEYPQALQKLNALVGRTNDATAFLQIGAIHDELKEYEAARDAYEKVLAINAQSPPALNNLAYIYAEHLNKLDKAYQLAEKAREVRPYDYHIGDTLGWILYKQGDYPRALAILQDSGEKAPTDAEIQYHVGMAHYMMDEEEAARASLQRAVSSTQDFAEKDIARSRLTILNINPDNATANVMADLQKELDDNPKDPVILNRIGALQEKNAPDKAAETYEDALQQDPSAVPIMAKLARLYALKLNDPDKAMSLATSAHKLAPENPQVSAILGHLVYRTGDYTWALSLLENAADQIPDQPELLYDLAWAYYSVGRISDARATMQKALLAGASFGGADDAKRFITLADALGSMDKIQAAANQARTILMTESKYVPALMVAGLDAERTGDFKGAQDDYTQALAALPMFTVAERQLAILDARHFCDDAQGCAAAEKARAAYPNDTEVARSLGILSYYQQKYPRSAELLQETASSNPSDGELYYYLGMDHFQLKENKESKASLEKALSLKIPDNLASQAKTTLASLKQPPAQ